MGGTYNYDHSEVYVRDVAGNILAIYEMEATHDINTTQYLLYGMGRVGAATVEETVLSSHVKEAFAGTGQEGNATGVGGVQDGAKLAEAIFDTPIGISMDKNGVLYVVSHHGDNNGNNEYGSEDALSVRIIDGDQVTTEETDITYSASLRAIAIDDATGDRFVSCSKRIYKKTNGGNYTLFKTLSTFIMDLFIKDSKMYVTRLGNKVDVFDMSGTELASYGLGTAGDVLGNATTTAKFNKPDGITVDENGVIYIVDANNDKIKSIKNNTVYLLADLSSYSPDLKRLAVDASGSWLYVTDKNEKLYKVSTDENNTSHSQMTLDNEVVDAHGIVFDKTGGDYLYIVSLKEQQVMVIDLKYYALKPQYEITDHLGNVRAVVEEGTKTVNAVASYTFDETEEGWVDAETVTDPLDLDRVNSVNNTLEMDMTKSVNTVYTLDVNSPSIPSVYTGVFHLTTDYTTTNSTMVSTLNVLDGSSNVLVTKVLESGVNEVYFNLSATTNLTINIHTFEGGTAATTGSCTIDNVVLENISHTATIVSAADYYPFGKPMPGRQYVSAIASKRFGYQGQFAEADEETGWNSFYYREYDSEIGRFTSYDPMEEFHSPYEGMGNNPVSLYDPTGGKTGGGGGIKWGKNPGSSVGGKGAALTKAPRNFS